MRGTIPWDGETIKKPGIYSGMSLEAYHEHDICDGPSISSSGLRTLFQKSPAHFFCQWNGNTKAEDQEETRAMVFGRAAHHLYLRNIGQGSYSDLFITQPTEYPDQKTGELKKWTYNAIYCKEWRETAAAGKSVLTASEAEHLVGMSLVLGREPLIQHGILNGDVERSMFLKDEKTGIWLKSRPDAVPNDATYADYKTCRSVLWPDLMRSIGERGYHAQGALIRTVVRELLGITAQFLFALVFQEKTPPYPVWTVYLKEELLDLGERQNRVALDTFAQCLKTNRWPGPAGDQQDAAPIGMSEYIQKEIEYRIEHGIV